MNGIIQIQRRAGQVSSFQLSLMLHQRDYPVTAQEMNDVG